MARFTIYSKDGNVIRHVGEPQYSGSYMNVDFIEFRTIASPVPIDWQIGDYVDYHRTGLRYKLYSLPQPKKVARRGEYGAAFEYANVQFHAATKELEIAPFRDLVSEDNKIHFSTRPDVSTYEDVYGIARRIQECMNDLYPNRWKIEVYGTEDTDLLTLFSETKEYSVSGGSCFDALSQIYDTWKNVGWIHTYDKVSNVDVITIGRSSVRDADNTSDAFIYGMGNGLTSIKKASANEGEFATRLYVYGSERNIPPRYYNNKEILNKDSVDIRNLMIPIKDWGKTDNVPDARKAYLQADDAIVEKYGLIPRTVYFDGNENEEIYPSVEGLTEAGVRAAMISLGLEDSEYLPNDVDWRVDEVQKSFNPEDDGVTVTPDGKPKGEDISPTFRMNLHNFGFNPIEQAALANEEKPVLSMKSGYCAGREFPIKKASFDSGFWYLELERQVDDSLNIAFPNKDYPINKGDKFVFLNIAMPEYYVTLAASRLIDAGQKMLADYTRVSTFYEPGINPIKIKEGGKLLRAGMYMQVRDEDVIDTEDNTDYVLIDTLTIDEKSEIPTYKVTLREQKRAARNFSALEDMIEDAKGIAKKEGDRARQYTDRRFFSAQETLSMLAGAFKNFSEGINPVTVRTMALLIGDQSLQFKFTASAGSLDDIPCPLVWDNETKQMKATESVLIHMTLGVDEVTAKGTRKAEDYKHWVLPSEDLEQIEDTDARYAYVRVPANDTIATGDVYVFSKSSIPMDAEKGFYHLLVGILNSEYNGSRDFVTLYGFTEVLPGQITTDVIRSADGSCYFDLANNEIGGVIKFLEGSEGAENLLQGMSIGGENLLRNSGFTGDYLSETLADDVVLEASKELFSDPLDHWMASGEVSVENAEGVAVSGKAVTIANNASISQELYYDIIVGEEYVLSFMAKGLGTNVNNIRINFGGIRKVVTLTEEWAEYTLKLTPISEDKAFLIQRNVSSASICNLKLEKGNVATEWSASALDNSSDRAYYQSLKYLQDAIEKGSTTIGGGLVLTNTISVGNYVDGNMVQETGGISGTWTDEESIFAWAGGTYENATNAVLENGENEANFVVTHGGRVILNDAKVRGTIEALGGKIGGLEIKDNGISVNTDKEGLITFNRQGVFARQKDGSYVQLGTCASHAILIAGKDSAGGICYSDEDKYKIAAQIVAADQGHAIHCLSGLYAGLRPNIRAIYGSNTLDILDHTIIVDNDSAITITLPSNPPTGQTYKLIHRSDKDVTLNIPSNVVILDVSKGYEPISSLGPYSVVTLTYFDLIWYAEIN